MDHAKNIYKSAYGTYRSYRNQRACCLDQDYLPGDSRLFLIAARHVGMDAEQASRIAESCFSNKRSMDDRLYELNEHVTGCLQAERGCVQHQETC